MFVGTARLTDSLEIGLRTASISTISTSRSRARWCRVRCASDCRSASPSTVPWSKPWRFGAGRLEAFVRDQAAESVAVCLLHAYLNDTHERRVGEHLRRALPGLAVSLSSEILPIAGEYERGATVVPAPTSSR